MTQIQEDQEGLGSTKRNNFPSQTKLTPIIVNPGFPTDLPFSTTNSLNRSQNSTVLGKHNFGNLVAVQYLKRKHFKALIVSKRKTIFNNFKSYFLRQMILELPIVLLIIEKVAG